MNYTSFLPCESVPPRRLANLAIALSVVTMVSANAANAQPSSLPPWSQQRSLPPDVTTSTQFSQPGLYVPARRSVRLDPTLSYISADEPVVQAGFPPMPNQSDLTGSVGSWTNTESRVIGEDNGNSQLATQTHQGIRHLPAGAFMQKGASKNNRSSQSIIPAKGDFGQEPPVNTLLDKGVPAELPTPLMLNQSKTQDLSLPEDEFNENNAKQKSPPCGNSLIKQLKRQTLQPLMQLNGAGSSMINQAIHF